MPSRRMFPNGRIEGIKPAYEQTDGLPTQNGRSKVGMRIKFYEAKDVDQKPTFQGRTQLQKPENYFTSSHTNQRPMSYAGKASTEQPIYAKVNKTQGRAKRNSERGVKGRTAGEVLPDFNTEKTIKDALRKQEENREMQDLQHAVKSRRSNGTCFAATEESIEDENQYHEIGPALLERTAPQSSNVAEEKDAIAFLSTAEIGKIYQSRPKESFQIDYHRTKVKSPRVKEKRATSIYPDSLETNQNPMDYQKKIVESKNALLQLRKSLSNDDRFVHTDKTLAKNEEKTLKIINRHGTGHTKTNGDLQKSEIKTRKKLNLNDNRSLKIGDLTDHHISGGKTSEARHGEKQLKTNGHLSNHKKKATTTSRMENFPIQTPKTNSNSADQRWLTMDETERANFTEAKVLNLKTECISVEHESAVKQDSNGSMASTSSTISKKLLMLQENGKSPKQSPKRSKKMYVKRFSWKKTPGFENTASITDPASNNTTQTVAEQYKAGERKRHTISAVEYTLADVSPASTRSDRSLTLPLRKSNSESPKSSRQIESTTPLLTPSSHRSHESSRKSPSSVRTATPSSHSSLMQGDSHFVFKMDLDEIHGKNYNTENEMPPEKSEEKPKVSEMHLEKGARKTKNLNKWIQTDGPPIRAPPSRSLGLQTGINPCVCVSKRLQVRPWNLPDYLINCATQTPLKRTTDAATQTHDKKLRSRGSQTRSKKLRDSNSQTPIPPTKREISIQAAVTTKSVDVQTPDEDSDVWGTGVGVSLDRLIWNGAIKRSRSIGHGIITNEETLDESGERSASMDSVSGASSGTSTPSTQGPVVGTQTTGKITTYSWNENGKFVKIFVSYSGIHLIPSKNIQVKTNGINLHLIVEEPFPETTDNTSATKSSSKEGETHRTLTSTLYLNRLRRPVACLSYNIQRDMITIMLRKQKQTPWNSLVFKGKIV